MHRRKAVLRANGEVGPVGRHKLQCDQCDYSATTTTHLKNHLMQHLDERPHQCSVCSKAFRTRPQAAEHEMAVHGAAEEVECDQCDKRFASRGGLARHRQAHHSGRSHACADCDKTFASRASLRSHERRAHRAEVAVQEEELCPSCGLAGSSCGCGVVPGPGPAPASVPCPVCGKQVWSRRGWCLLLAYLLPIVNVGLLLVLAYGQFLPIIAHGFAQVVRRNLASHLHYHRQVNWQ
jgi:hypothetical protein